MFNHRHALATLLGGLLLTGAHVAFTAGAPQTTDTRPALQPPAKMGIPGDYRTRWTQVSKLAVSGLHWNQSVIVYSNHGAAVYQANQKTWWAQEQASGWADSDSSTTETYRSYPPGTILIKEGFVTAAKQLKPTFLAIMIKRPPGFDPEYGDWEYVQSTPQGKVLLRGPFSSPGISTACGNCHTNVADRDFVFATTGQGSK